MVPIWPEHAFHPMNDLLEQQLKDGIERVDASRS